MKRLRTFRILLLFIALFSAAAYALFGGYLTELYTNLRTGGGNIRFQMAVRGGDGNIYAFGDRGGPRLVGLNEGKRLFERSLSGLPKSFKAEDIYVTRTGAVLLSLYEPRADGLYYGLYAAEDGLKYEALLSVKCEGDNVPAQRRSAALSAINATGSKAQFFLKRGGQYDRYAYDPGSELVLLPEGPFLFSGDYAAGIVVNNTAYVAGADGRLYAAGDFGPAELPGGGIITKLLPAGEGFGYIDAGSSALVLFDINAKAPADMYNLLELPCAPEDAVWLSADGNEVLVIESGEKLYLLTPDAAFDLTPLLYPPKWESGAVLAAFAAAIIFLAFACRYLFSEVRKLYFPIMLRGALTLGLFAAAAVCAAMNLYIRPVMLDNARSAAQTALMTSAAQFAGQTGPDGAAERIAAVNADFADTEFFTLSKTDGEWRVVESTGGRYAEGFVARTPGGLGFLARGAESRESFVEIIDTPSPLYCAFVPVSRGTVFAAVFDASAMEARFAREAGRVELCLYACAYIIVLLALFSLSAVTRGIGRITRGVDMLSAGEYGVTITQNSGDELSALARSFNALAGELNKDFTSVRRRDESYLQFVPQQLVTLLGVGSIEEVDKNTSSSRDMAMMVVWLGFPEHVYQSDPETLFQNINEAIGHTSGIVARNGGTIYNFTYHGYDAVFNSELEAVSTAVEIRQEIIALNDERLARGSNPITLRVALDKGNMMMGVIGDDSRMVPTVVSACLNRARVLVGLSHKLEANILCTLAVAEAAKEYALRYIGKTADAEEVRVYEIFDGDTYDVRTAKETTREQFSEALYLLYGREFTAAKRVFMDIARRYQGDGTTKYYLYLADKYEKEPPETFGLS